MNSLYRRRQSLSYIWKTAWISAPASHRPAPRLRACRLGALPTNSIDTARCIGIFIRFLRKFSGRPSVTTRGIDLANNYSIYQMRVIID
ncbi:unnamed protein product [Cylicocyclus nassatus]|uniref:Uncharacterized protein n=1 Tax=Cylicocyclus nassatus TaxID=53992 RepID=A0AA36H834_CYLNA|nr:unnamed protein product [Cylicocyclus nassatus]